MVFFHTMNYIQKVYNRVESSSTNKGGKYSKESSMGKSDVSHAGNVAYDKKGVHLYNRFRTFLEELKLHKEFGNVETEYIQLWKAKQEALVQSKKCRRINVVTEDTEALVFNLLGNGLALGAV